MGEVREGWPMTTFREGCSTIERALWSLRRQATALAFSEENRPGSPEDVATLRAAILEMDKAIATLTALVMEKTA